ncbi:glycoside hydrolase family 32 protein [Mucilaginibacter kameinonensis]|uniref:glycoside hydrolase family 32 protein n=1 Tax=Mucilaginibacter kameinonensis TaxID=452286 RepID=UPI000EF845C8|nr:glycoside hydrolase family 32 protein [Mucilaginibacter kameinonensis]
MKTKFGLLMLTFIIALNCICKAQDSASKTYSEQYRPQIHFSPKQHWTNDPNGMVYFNHTYHLFFQYYPKGSTWGPMHWGHATSPDLIHWKEKPIALYPDSLGYIFSGSAVVDSNNTSGFGKKGKMPLVAIFTHHDPKGEKEGTDKFQNQSLAYSLDNGNTWTKYKGNPVLRNPGIKDFRDPKVMWYAKEKKWVMTLATKDHITFYSAPDLKNWKKESEFGLEIGAHGGVWECPDLFPLKVDGKTHWVLIVNINPGGPNGGSATQYFVGQFDGNKFTPVDTKTRWLDYGPDEYAGITWGNTGARKIFLGWMSNWEYANQVPTEKWRNAMTIPRDLALRKVNGELLLASVPVGELKNIVAGAQGIVSGKLPAQCLLKANIVSINDYTVTLSNSLGEELVIGYDKKANQYYIDRTKAGKVDFQKDFKGRFVAPRFATTKTSDLTLVIDGTSVELFADKGLTTMTTIFFPNKPFDRIAVKGIALKQTAFKSIWK